MEIESNHVGIASKLIFYGFYFGTITSNIKFRVIWTLFGLYFKFGY